MAKTYVYVSNVSNMILILYVQQIHFLCSTYFDHNQMINCGFTNGRIVETVKIDIVYIECLLLNCNHLITNFRLVSVEGMWSCGPNETL